MKGTLIKNEKGWVVMYQVVNSIRSLPLHPYSIMELSILSDKKMEDRIGDEVEFDKAEYISECKGLSEDGCFMDSPGHNCGCQSYHAKLRHRKLDLTEMEENLDKQLAKETSESLTEWIDSKRGTDVDMLAQEWIDENGHKWSNNTNEVGDNYGSFVAGYNKAQEVYNVQLADIRNKLTPLLNLIQMLEFGYVTPSDKFKRLVEKEIINCKNSIVYLSEDRFKKK